MKIKSETKPWFYYYFKSLNGIIGIIILSLLSIGALVALFHVTPYDPVAQDVAAILKPPSAHHIFGTDQFGRDIFSRVLDGVRRSLAVSLLSVAIASIAGSFLGVAGGYFGTFLDTIVTRMSDVFFAFPAILMALAIVSSLGHSWLDTAIAIGIVYTPIFVRVTRGPVLSLKETDYVKSGRVLGFSTPRILFRHLLPNVMPIVLVQIALSLSWAILTESGLSFLGLGTQAPDASLGLMVSEAQALAAFAWWTLAGPSLALIFAVVSLNLVGDGLRDSLDPTRRSI
jgi:peptide/nickel transport system permease protein